MVLNYPGDCRYISRCVYIYIYTSFYVYFWAAASAANPKKNTRNACFAFSNIKFQFFGQEKTAGSLEKTMLPLCLVLIF